MSDKIDQERKYQTDLQEKRKNRKGFQFFEKGTCHLLHPDLSILDKIEDCHLLYELEHKILYVRYGNKELMTPKVSTVVEIIKNYYGE